MNPTPAWPRTLNSVAGTLNRSFGYASVQDRTDALYNAIYRLLTLQQSSGIALKEPDMQRWLYCVATRMLLDARRVQQRRRLFSDLVPQFDGDEDTFFDPIDEDVTGPHTDIGLDISAALSSLSPSLRSSFELHTQGFKAEEIAVMLCISREAAHKRVQRARREMQLFLQDYL